MSIIKVENLTYIYGAGTPFEKKALDNINIEIEQGQFIGMIGHTGSGKSTLVQLLNGLTKPASGKIFFNNHDISTYYKKIRELRFRVGLVFQYPEYQLFEETVYKDIAFGPANMGIAGKALDTRIRNAAKYVGISEALLEKSPFELSGGEKRRVAIAGVIAMEPEVLILDEPTAGLDPLGRDEILEMINNYRVNKNKTIILVSHSMEDVAQFADRVIVMDKGKTVMFDTVQNVFSNHDQLEKMGLKVPEITSVFIKLKNMGLPVSDNIFTLEQAVLEINRLLGGTKL